MGTREVYEEKLQSANLHYDPTMNPGLGSARCPRCLSLIDPNSRNEEWTITSVLHDFTAVAGSGLGALLTAVHGFNTGIPYIQKHVKGPKWLQLAIGIPPLLMFSGAGAVSGDQKNNEEEEVKVTCFPKPKKVRAPPCLNVAIISFLVSLDNGAKPAYRLLFYIMPGLISCVVYYHYRIKNI